MEDRQIPPIYAQTGNWNRKDWRGNQGIFRVIAQTSKSIYVIQIGTIENDAFCPFPAPKTKQRYKVWARKLADEEFKKGHLFHIDERGIPAEMLAAEVPTPGKDFDYDKRKALVAYIEANWGDAVLTDKSSYAQAITVTSTHFNMPPQTVRVWYTRHLFYGRVDKALVVQTWKRGGPGKSRRVLKGPDGQYVLRGAKPKKQIEDGDTHDLRKLFTPKLYREYSYYLKTHAWCTSDKFTAVHERFRASRYAFNRDPKTMETVAHQIRVGRLPVDSYMRKVGRAIYRVERHAKAKALREMDNFRPTQVKGSARDIVHEQIPVLDIDATSVSNGVLFPDLPDDVKEHGKPTVYLGVDRGSSAMVGYYVSFEPENGRGYLACLFSCYTPKDRELHRWGVKHLKGFVYGCTAKVFFDRGPGISKKVLEVMERLRANMLIAAPYRPKAKGHVEGSIGIVQKKMSDLPGSTFTRGSVEEDKVYLKQARSESVSLKTFMQKLLTAISDHNLKIGTARDHTPDMLLQKVIPCPADIYWYKKGRIRGDAKQQWLWSTEKIFRTLCPTEPRPAPGGVVSIRGNRLQFTSTELEKYCDDYYRQHGATAIVTVLEVVQSTDHAMWEMPDGTLGALHPTSRTARAYKDGTELTVAASNRKRSSLAYDAMIRGLDMEQEKIDREKAERQTGRVAKTTMKRVKKVDTTATSFIIPPHKELLQNAASTLSADNAESVLNSISRTLASPPKENLTVDSLYAFQSGQRLMVDIAQ